MRRILIVDDEHVIADTLRVIFGKGGFEARVAYSTDDALLSAREFPPELLLCDINMPGRDGLELIQELLREQPNCRVMVLTGSVPSMRRVREGTRSFARQPPILVKPCQPDELLRQAGEILLSA